LTHGVDPRITADPYWPTLADRLTAAERAGIDVTSLVGTVRDRPLPDEQPAAALWWRLARHLSPAAMTACDFSARTLRPDWTFALAAVVGSGSADRVLADPSWPALVAAVSSARSRGWQPEQLLSTAYELLCAGHPDDEPLRPDELTNALVWRIGVLTDPTSAGSVDASPPPVDLDQLPTPDGVLDDDWLASLSEPDDAEAAHPEQPGNEQVAVSSRERATEGAERDGRLRIERHRLLDLNQQAAAFFTTRFPDSWASRYLTERLGTDLADENRFIRGYAPAGWTGLTDHLRHLGATDAEIVAAGLGSYASTGRVIDRFRDRMVFAIRDRAEIHGWIGRRNPAFDGHEDGRTVPKYLNTAETDLFTKGHELYGLTEGASALTAGAVPVLVEGPLDALAVTLAGTGEYVGVAPLGTALTDTQADDLRPFIGAARPGVIVATDADPAGQQAAQRIFWQLTARGDDPRHLAVATGKDPAEMLQTAGATALRQALAASPSLASTLIDARVAVYADRLDTVEGQVHATRRAAEVVAALPAESWPAHLTDLVTRTGIAPDIALFEVIDAARRRTKGPSAVRAARARGWLPRPELTPGEEPDSPIPAPTCSPVERPLAEMLSDSVRAAQHASTVRRSLHPGIKASERHRL
jgi:DNA primase catalytic core